MAKRVSRETEENFQLKNDFKMVNAYFALQRRRQFQRLLIFWFLSKFWISDLSLSLSLEKAQIWIFKPKVSA